MPSERITQSAAPSLRRGRTAAVVGDIIDGARAEISTTGLRATRIAHVEGLISKGSAGLFEAMNASGIPRHGEPFPDIPNLWVTGVEAVYEPDSNTQARVIIRYGFPDIDVGYFDNEPSETTTPRLEVSSSVQSTTTNKDVHGKVFVIDNYHKEFREPDGTPIGTNALPEPAQGGEVNFQQPTATVRYFRREPGSPGLKSKQYVGTINASPVFGDPAHFWMCTRLDGSTDDGGRSYNTTYEFQRHPDSWDVVVVWRDPETGQPGQDVRVGIDDLNGAKIVQLYREEEFENLNLTL